MKGGRGNEAENQSGKASLSSPRIFPLVWPFLCHFLGEPSFWLLSLCSSALNDPSSLRRIWNVKKPTPFSPKAKLRLGRKQELLSTNCKSKVWLGNEEEVMSWRLDCKCVKMPLIVSLSVPNSILFVVILFCPSSFKTVLRWEGGGKRMVFFLEEKRRKNPAFSNSAACSEDESLDRDKKYSPTARRDNSLLITCLSRSCHFISCHPWNERVDFQPRPTAFVS